MAVIREQRRFKIGQIGIARASEEGKIVGDAIAESANKLSEIFFRRAATEAEKAGTEAGMAISDVTSIDPKTGKPVAYKTPMGFGSIAAEAYQRVVLRRFHQSIDDEIKLKAKELAVQFEDAPDSVGLYTNAMSDYIASMANVAQGQFKTYITDVGTSYLNSTRTALTIDKVRSERAAAKASQKIAVENGLNDIEFNVANLGPNALNGPTQTQGLIQSVNVTISDGQQSGLFTPAETSGHSAKQRLAITKGLIRYAAKQTNDPETLQLLQAAVGTQNPNLVPKGFEYVADAMRGMGNDYDSLAALEKFSDGLLSDSVSYANVLQEQEVKRQEADANLRIFDIENNAPAIAAAEANIAINPQTDPFAFGVRVITGYNQMTQEARSLLQSGLDKDSEAAIKQRDIRLKGQAEGLYLRALDGLSTEDTRQLELAISERDPSIAPPSAQSALTTLIRIQDATGADVLSDFGSEISSYRDAAGKQIDLQIKHAAAREALSIDVNAIANSANPKADVEAALRQLGAIQGMDETLRENTRNDILFNGAKASLFGFFATSPSEAQITEAKSMLEGGPVASGVLTQRQMEQLSLSKSAAEAAGKTSSMRTIFNGQSTVAADRRKAFEKEQQRQIDLQNIRLGQGDPGSKDHRMLLEEDLQKRYAKALGGRTLSSIWSDPEAMSDPNLAPIFNELASSNVMPESLQNAFISLADGVFQGLNPAQILSHYENFKSYSYGGVVLDNPMMDALSNEDKVMLDYLSDAAKIMGSQALPEIFRTKSEFETNERFKERADAFFDEGVEKFVADLKGMDAAPPAAYDGILASALSLFAGSRMSGLSKRDIKARLERQIEHSYPSGGGVVFGPNLSERTAYPLSKAAFGNEDLFKEHVRDSVYGYGIVTGNPAFGSQGKDVTITKEGMFGHIMQAANEDFIFLQPLDTGPNNEVRYVVRQRRAPEDGGNATVMERITDEDGTTYLVPMIVSNRDPRFLAKVSKRTRTENAREIEEGNSRLQQDEELLQRSFGEIEGLE